MEKWRKLLFYYYQIPTLSGPPDDKTNKMSVRPAKTQSDQSLRCPPEESLGTKLPFERTAKTLIRLGGCPGWSESSLDAHATLLVLSWDGSSVALSSDTDTTTLSLGVLVLVVSCVLVQLVHVFLVDMSTVLSYTNNVTAPEIMIGKSTIWGCKVV